MTTQLFLVRHAESTRARAGMWGRLFDAPLENGFQEQLKEAKAVLAAIGRAKVFTSPLLRCRQTAAYVCPQADATIIEEFRAYHSGVFEDKTENYLREHHIEYLNLTFRERFLRPQFGEESMAAQSKRVREGFLNILDPTYENLVIVAHYSTINIVAHLCARNWNVDTYADGVFDVAEGSIFSLSIESGLVANDLMHQIESEQS